MSPGSWCIALWAMSAFLFPRPFFLKGQERVGGGQRGVRHLRAHHELGGYLGRVTATVQPLNKQVVLSICLSVLGTGGPVGTSQGGPCPHGVPKGGGSH